MGRGSPDHGKLEDCYLWELISEALNDMASEVINLLPCFFSSHSSLTITSSQSIATTHAFALLGLVATEKIDTFNAPTPFYIPSLEEMKQVVEEEGSFSITAMEQFEAGWDAVADQHSGGQDQQHDTIDHENGAVHERRKSYAGRMAMGVRAVLERMLKNHFGDGGFLFRIQTRGGKRGGRHVSVDSPGPKAHRNPHSNPSPVVVRYSTVDRFPTSSMAKRTVAAIMFPYSRKTCLDELEDGVHDPRVRNQDSTVRGRLI
ncbi:hypothetical protein GW17_00038219 [Ensete ventricosum]|nr:hypothetical protein GW17_00038219 [Ensete ventricosum]